METVAGIFQSRAEAERAVQQLHSQGIPNDRIALLTPGMDNEQVEKTVPTADSEQPGMGKAMGGTVGGAIGVAGGASLGAAAGSLLVPGVGPVIAGGILGAAILGAGGTATGMAAGEALEEALVQGLPHDELYLYEDALRKGRSVVIAFVDTDESKDTARTALVSAGAESIDAARESWWLELRDRRGFEAALKTRGKDSGAGERTVLNNESDEAFRCGYERGKSYQKSLQGKTK
jgi:hypothetical protein